MEKVEASGHDQGMKIKGSAEKKVSLNKTGI